MSKIHEAYQTIVHPLEPVFDKNSKILILGSFPSVKTRAYGFFYGNPNNRFWPLMEQLFNENISTAIEERRDFLIRHHIALYDSIYQCDIVGSDDSSIKNVIPSELSSIFDIANIRQVFCNGAASCEYYKKYHSKLSGIPGTKLPSTSPANAKFRIADLLVEWEKIIETLKWNSEQ